MYGIRFRIRKRVDGLLSFNYNGMVAMIMTVKLIKVKQYDINRTLNYTLI